MGLLAALQLDWPASRGAVTVAGAEPERAELGRAGPGVLLGKAAAEEGEWRRCPSPAHPGDRPGPVWENGHTDSCRAPRERVSYNPSVRVAVPD